MTWTKGGAFPPDDRHVRDDLAPPCFSVSDKGLIRVTTRTLEQDEDEEKVSSGKEGAPMVVVGGDYLEGGSCSKERGAENCDMESPRCLSGGMLPTESVAKLYLLHNLADTRVVKIRNGLLDK